MLPRRFNAAYKGLIAAPGIPNACSMPSRSITRTAASAAVIFAMAGPPPRLLGQAVAASSGISIEPILAKIE
jgi:hypothetical protein